MPNFATPLAFIEGTTPDVSDNPFIRIDPIRKCGVAATTLDFDAFAVVRGICISGSNNLRDYQAIEATGFCRDGVGGYAFGYYFMTVYELVDLGSFADSAGITAPSPSPTPSLEPDGGSLSLPSIVLISLTILVSVCITLFSY